MKINPRIYDYCEPEKMVERQELEDNVVEIYKLNDYPELLEEFTAKGKFAVWSSYDGRDYRLFVEDGYYEKLKPLYTKKVNNIWLKFWDECEMISTKFRNIVLPLMVLVVAAVIGISVGLKNYKTVGNILTLAVPLAFFFFVMMYRRITNRKIMESNQKSVEEIKKYLGANKFENLLQAQRTYIDEYFKYEDEESDDLFLEENKDDSIKAEVTAVADVEEENK